MTMDFKLDDADALGFDPARLDTIPNFFESYRAREKLSGYSILIARNGKIAHQSQRGHSAFEGGHALSKDTIFRIYSMTKPITSVAIMMLVERGRIMLQDPITKYLPQFAKVRVFEKGTPREYTTREPDRMITVHDLMTHQSGLTYDFMLSHPVDALYRNKRINGARSEKFTLEEFIDELVQMPLQFTPGSQWNYSVATDVLGRIVEVVSGQTLDVFLSENIFVPLGMNDTSFTIDDDKRGRLAHNYARDPVTGVTSLADAPETTIYKPGRRFLSGGGGLLSTIGDYLKFCEMMRRDGVLNGARILGRKTVAYMTSNHLPNNETLMDRATGSFSEVSYGGTGFGLGFSVVVDPQYAPTITSRGVYSWGGLASTFFWVDPQEEMVVILMTQLMPSGTYPLRPQLQQLVYSALQ